MIRSKTSVILSLVICCVSAAVLLVWLISFPKFIHWFYFTYHALAQSSGNLEHVVQTLVPAFYACAPFAALALYLLIRLLQNILHSRVFILRNVQYLRLVSWCCYAVTAITFGFGFAYFPLMIVACATAIVGTLLRVVKNIMQAAVEMREENDLTI